MLSTAERSTLKLLLDALSGDSQALDSLFALTGSTAERNSLGSLLRCLAGDAAAINSVFSLSDPVVTPLTTAQRASLQIVLQALAGDAASLDALIAQVGFSPATLPGLVLWVDGRTQTYSDAAGTITSAAPTGRVRRINTTSPAGGSAQAPSAATSPYAESGGSISFHTGAGHYLAAPISQAVAMNDATIAASYTVRDLTYGAIIMNGSAQALGLSNFTSAIPVLNVNGVGVFVADPGPVYAMPPAGSQVSIVIRTTPTAVKASVVIDGVRHDYTMAATIPGTTVPGANWFIGWDGATAGFGMQGAIAQSAVFQRSITDAENDLLVAWLTAHPSTHYFPTDVPAVIITGDSIAAGLGLANRAQQWGFIAQASLDATQPVNLVNAAISGNTIAAQQTAYPTTMKPFYSASRARNIFVGAIGVNNMRTLLQDGPTTLANYYAYMDLAKADGFRVVACTILPTNLGPTFYASRAYFNTHLRAEWAARGYSALADVAGIVGMGADGDEASATYYQDQLHPTAAGDALMAPVYAAAIQLAIN